MLKLEIFTYHKVEYIALDTAFITLDREGMAMLASYRHGVGADRILLLDKSLGQLIAVTDNKGHYQMLSSDDCKIAHIALGKAEKTVDVHCAEARLTEYFLQKLQAASAELKIAG